MFQSRQVSFNTDQTGFWSLVCEPVSPSMAAAGVWRPFKRLEAGVCVSGVCLSVCQQHKTHTLILLYLHASVQPWTVKAAMQKKLKTKSSELGRKLKWCLCAHKGVNAQNHVSLLNGPWKGCYCNCWWELHKYEAIYYSIEPRPYSGKV